MAFYPYKSIDWIERRFLKVDADGLLVPNASGYLLSFTAAGSTPLATIADQDGTDNPVRVDFDADGRAETDLLYAVNAGYKFEVYDADDTLLYTADKKEDIGQIFASTYGTLQTFASNVSVGSGYVVVPTDRLIVIDGTGGANPCNITLPAASDYSAALILKNIGDVNVAVAADGSDTIDGVAGVRTLLASDGTNNPTLELLSDGVSNWWIRNAGNYTSAVLPSPVIAFQTQALTATGTTGSNAAQVTAAAPGLLTVVGGDGTKGIGFPTGSVTVGNLYVLKNVSTGTVKVYSVGATINGTTGTTAYSISATGNLGAMFMCVVAGAWQVVPLAT